MAPSFNDIRLILNSAQLISLVEAGGPELVTFDGDVTLYEDGGRLERGDAVVERLVWLLGRGCGVGVVTAAGPAAGVGYKGRLGGLVEGVREMDERMGEEGERGKGKRGELVVMGGESSYLFGYEREGRGRVAGLRYVEREEW